MKTIKGFFLSLIALGSNLAQAYGVGRTESAQAPSGAESRILELAPGDRFHIQLKDRVVRLDYASLKEEIRPYVGSHFYENIGVHVHEENNSVDLRAFDDLVISISLESLEHSPPNIDRTGG